MRTPPYSLPGRALLVTVLSLALIAVCLVVLPPKAKAATAAPSGAFALGGGLGGEIDERTGQLSVNVPLVSVHGRGDAGVDLSLNWQLARAAANVDRSGWGAGWSIGSSFVDVTGLRQVYPASGGSYEVDPSVPSGLKHYTLRDLTFKTVAGSLPARPGSAAVAYGFTIVYNDGRTDYFNADGNLAARVDRFGNRTDLTWRAIGSNAWQPTSVVDPFGLKTTLDYSTPNVLKIISPQRSDRVVPVTTVAFGPGAAPCTGTPSRAVCSVTDPVGQVTSIGYTSVAGAPKPLITSITNYLGARTKVAYQRPYQSQPGLIAVDTLDVLDPALKPVSPTRTFRFADPNQHTYTGNGKYASEGALFAAADPAYTYTTSLTTGATTTASTYDAQRRLTRRSVVVSTGPGTKVTAQSQAMGYASPVTTPNELKPNYARPSSITITHSAGTSSAGLRATSARTTTTKTDYDDHGRIISVTDETGSTTTSAYDDRFGLVTTQTTTGADGAQATMVNTLTDDGRSIAASTTSQGRQGQPLSAAQTTAYAYDDWGQLSLRTLRWAEGAGPDAGQGDGPSEVVTKFDRQVDVARATQTITTTTAHGTDAAAAETTTVDLVSAQGTTHVDADGRTSTMTYDAIGRQTTMTTPGAMVTRTTYDSPTRSTVTGPDGRATRTTVDLLGRTVSVTDNVRDGKLVADPASRVRSATSYSADGSTVTATDQLGRTSTTTVDFLGRIVSKGGPTGMSHLTAYDDGAAHSEVATVVADGGSKAEMTTTTRYDHANREIGARTTYPAASGTGGRPGLFTTDPVRARTFDGMGRTSTSTDQDVTVTTDRSGPADAPVTSTATPKATALFPGQPLTAVTDRSLTGAATSRTLEQGDAVSPAVAVDYDAAGNLVTATDPGGRKTTYTYTAAGEIATKTSPSGIVTTSDYDPDTGLLAAVSTAAPGQPKRTVTYTRVPAGQPGAGQVQTVTDGTDTMTYGYDADGHRVSVGYPDGTSTAARYLDTGQLDTTTDVTGAVTSYTYDANEGTLTSAVQKRGATVLASVAYTYDAMSRIATTTRGNKVVTSHTYTNTNMLATQTTRSADGTVLEAHSYTYDSHKNPATRTDTYPAGGGASAPGSATWTTIYRYDAYDRLTDSAVYAGPLVDGKPTGSPTTSTSYTVDVGGDVVASGTTTRIGGDRPTTTTTTATNTIDASGRLTGRTTGGTSASQTFDDDGRVLKSLDGVTTSYHPDGSPATATTADGTSTSYAQWPDGTRRGATTTAADGAKSTVAFHYGPDGALVNDATSDGSMAAGTATTASYLVTTGREARTLLPRTAPSGSVAGTPAPPVATGAGVGYYLRDRHTSVTAQVDAGGAVTGSYAYTDYGSPARADGRATTRSGADGGRTNPYTYLGATAKAPWTDGETGLLHFAERSYDPGQGRFTSPDPVDAHNRYQAFNANPITYTDLSGRVSLMDIILDCVFTFMFLVATVMTAGAAGVALGAVAGAVEGTVTAGVVFQVASTLVGVAANGVGMLTSGVLAADDLKEQFTGEGFLRPNERGLLSTINLVAGAAATGAGLVQGLSEGALATMRATTATTRAASAATALEAAARANNAELRVANLNKILAATREFDGDVRPAQQVVVAAQAPVVPAVPADAGAPGGGVPQILPNADHAAKPRLPDAGEALPTDQQVLPGGEKLNLADEHAVGRDVLISESTNISNVVEKEVRGPTISDPPLNNLRDNLHASKSSAGSDTLSSSPHDYNYHNVIGGTGNNGELLTKNYSYTTSF